LCHLPFPTSPYPAQLEKDIQPPPRVFIGFLLVTTGKDAVVNINNSKKILGFSGSTTST
jgi:hypothetical protein